MTIKITTHTRDENIFPKIGRMPPTKKKKNWRLDLSLTLFSNKLQSVYQPAL